MDTTRKQQYLDATEKAITALETALASEREVWLSRCDKRHVDFPVKELTVKCLGATDDAMWDINYSIIAERVEWQAQVRELIDENTKLREELKSYDT